MRILFLLVFGLLACDTDSEIRVSLELEFEIRGRDADGDGTVEDRAPIDRSEGAPWQVFSDRVANDFENGPGNLTLHAVSMSLVDSSDDAQTLGDIFNGPIAFRLRTSDSQREHNLAVADIRASSEATTLDNFLIEFNYQLIEDREREDIIAGQMSGLFVGQAGDDFRGSGSVATLSARLEFGATPPAEAPP